MKKNLILIFLTTLVVNTSLAKSKKICGENGKVSEATLITVVKPIAILGYIPLDSNSITNKLVATKNKHTNSKLKQNTSTDSSSVRKNCKSSTCKLYPQNQVLPKKRINLY